MIILMHLIKYIFTLIQKDYEGMNLVALITIMMVIILLFSEAPGTDANPHLTFLCMLYCFL